MMPWLGYLAILLLLTSCGQSWSELPITAHKTTTDLVGSATPSGGNRHRSSMAQHLELTADVPENAFLSLQGRIWKRELESSGSTGDVTFSIRADGELVFTETIATSKRSTRFEREVPIPALAGKSVRFELDIERAAVEESYAEWQRATLEERVEISRQQAADGKNLLFVVVDTWRADHCSLYGYERPTTPHLERLAEDALVFENAISQCSWTAPAVASLLTGLYPTQHGVIHGEPLHPRFETLMEPLQAAGITTFGLSTNPLITATDGYAQGIETFQHLPWKRADTVRETFLHWLDNVSGLRWAAYLHYMEPHDPYDAPEPAGSAFTPRDYAGIFRRDKALNELFHTVNYGLDAAHPYDADDLAYLAAAYDGEILYWDQQFELLTDELRRRGLLDDTILILTGDHGEEFTEHGMFKHGHQLFDESIRVPLVIRDPGRVTAGRRRAQVETRGVFRAALQLMGIPGFKPRQNDLLRIDDGARWPAFSHTKHQPAPGKPRRPVVVSVRDGDWKLIRWVHEKRHSLFDLVDDSAEQHDLAGEETPRAEAYGELLDRWLGERRDSADAVEKPLDPELIEKLRSLGYIQ